MASSSNYSEQANSVVKIIPFDEFIYYKNLNTTIPKELVENIQSTNNRFELRKNLVDTAKNIINNIISGNNPNDANFLNYIRENLNKINNKNFNIIIAELRGLDINSRKHLQVFINEILTMVRNDIQAIKGVDIPDENKISYTLSMILEEFSDYEINDKKEGIIKIKDVFMDTITDLWEEYVDPVKPLDQNNVQKVEDFKGICSFIGLLIKYSNSIFDGDVYNYLNDLVDTIFSKNNDESMVESSNLLHGYRTIFNHYLQYVSKTKDFEKWETIKELHQKLFENNDKFDKLGKMHIYSCRQISKDIQKIENLD
jgi:hypothetical protein